MNLRKKITATLLILTVCSTLFGCGGEKELLYDSNAPIDQTSESPMTPDETPTADTENTSPLWETMQSFLDMSSLADGGLMSFTLPSSGAEIEWNDYGLPVSDGTLNMDLHLLAYSQQETNSIVTGTLFCCWNGEVIDFSVDGRQSEGGILQIDFPYFEELVVPFTAEALPIIEGDNTLYFAFFPYCEETGGYLASQSFIGFYRSEQACEGRNSLPITAEADLDPDRIMVVDDKNKAMTNDYVALSDLISFNGGSFPMEYTVRPEPTFYLNISNAMNVEGPSNRGGIMLFFADGQPQPVWNGKLFAAASVGDNEYKKSFSIKTGFKSGEQHDVLLAYAELFDDKSLNGSVYIQSAALRCTVE